MVDVSETGFCSPAAAAVHPGDGPAADSAIHHALVALGFRELPRNPDGAVGGEAMMGTLKAALRAPALGNKGLINFLNRRAGRGCRVRRHGGSLRVVSVARQRLSAATR